MAASMVDAQRGMNSASAAARRAHPGSPTPYEAAQVGPFGIRVPYLAPETILTEKTSDGYPRRRIKCWPENTSSIVWVHPKISRVQLSFSLPMRLPGSLASAGMRRARGRWSEYNYLSGKCYLSGEDCNHIRPHVYAAKQTRSRHAGVPLLDGRSLSLTIISMPVGIILSLVF